MKKEFTRWHIKQRIPFSQLLFPLLKLDTFIPYGVYFVIKYTQFHKYINRNSDLYLLSKLCGFLHSKHNLFSDP